MKILTEEEIADYHASPNVSVESRDYEFSFDDHEASFVKKRESEDIQIYYRLLLGYFRLKRIRIKFDPSISEQDLKFIREKYFPHFEGELIPLTSLRKSKIYDKVFSALNITAFKEVIGEELKRYLSQEIRTKLDPRELFDQSLDWLDHRQIERPSYRILSRIISEVVGTEKSRIKELVERNLTNETQDALMSLLTDSDSKEVFDAIRYQATDFRSSQISKEEKAYIHLKPIYEDVKAMVNQLALSKANIEYYASLLNHYDVWELKRSDKTNFCLYFACFISQRFKDITDYFVSAFEHHYKKIHSSAKESVKNRIIRERESMAALMVKAGEVLELFNDKTLSDPELRRSSEELLSSEQRTVVANYLKSIEVDEEAYYWEYIDSINTKGLKILRKIFQHLKFIEPPGDLGLYNQMLKLKSELETDGKCLTFDRRLIFKKNRVHLFGDDKTLISHRAEYYIYRLISGRLGKTHLGVEHSTEFSPLDDSLISTDDFESNSEKLIAAINSPNLEMSVESLLNEKKDRLSYLLSRTAKRITTRENESVILTTASGKKTWTVKQVKGRNEVNDRIFMDMNKISISSVIAVAARETNFYNQIRHIKYRQKDPEFSGKFICSLIANATRLGVYKMADICPYTYEELKNFEANFLRAPTLENAADCISDEISKLPIFKHYNFHSDSVHGSIDGQKLNSKRNTVRTRYSSKNFGDGKGLSALTFLINHVPVNVGMMPLNHHESHYTFDLVYNNSSHLQADVISTDTHGTNKCNFALLDLYGWIFAPRYKNVSNELDKLFLVSENKHGFSLSLATPINEKKISEGWGHVQRICVSLHQRDISQYEIVKKISRSPDSNKMLDALKEYDRLVKAIYLLEYIDDDSLKHYVQKALNRGEAYHFLQKSISTANGPSSFRGKSDREIDVWYACTRLLANCIIYFNSALMSNLLTRYEKQEKYQLADMLKKVSPVAWAHMLFKGKYLLDDINELPSMLDLSLILFDQ